MTTLIMVTRPRAGSRPGAPAAGGPLAAALGPTASWQVTVTGTVLAAQPGPARGSHGHGPAAAVAAPAGRQTRPPETVALGHPSDHGRA
jgi:hypothetical protein